jgi:hypothetical protein
MLEKLDFLVRFWALKSRQAEHGAPLSAAEQIELLSLLQLVTTDLTIPAPGELAKTKDAVSVELAGGGTVAPANLRWVSAGALLLTCHELKPAGQSVVLYATDAVEGVEYTIPCHVLWSFAPRTTGDVASIALAVDGAPTRVAFGETTGIRVASWGAWAQRNAG